MRCFLRLVALSSLLLALSLRLNAQQPGETDQPAEQTPSTSAPTTGGNAKATEKAKEPKEKEEEKPPVVTHHEIRSGGKTLKYTATAGLMPIKNADGDTEAHIFFMAYTLDNAPTRAHRPLTFCFNGGPGSSSVWLHMGAIGPRRVRLQSNGDMPRPPFELEDNQETWNRWDKTLQNSHSEGKYPTRELQNGRFQKDTRGRRLEWSAQKPRRPLQSFLSGFPR